MDTVSIAKSIMKKFQSFPDINNGNAGELKELFNHPSFLNSNEIKQKEMMLISSLSKYSSEMEYPFDKYFGIELYSYLKDKDVLDLGCFTGGRSVAWFERYHLKSITGVDVDQVFVDASENFASQKGINGRYVVGYGEHLPFNNEQFDAILTFDVFEHVQDLKMTLDECYRVLRPGGKLMMVFPGFYQPIEHHLSLVTHFPGLHYIFSGETLVKAYYEIIKERGRDAYWYQRSKPTLEPWEKGNTINGTTLQNLIKLIRNQNWEIVHLSRKPIGSIGRTLENKKAYKMLSTVLVPFTFVPYVREVVLHRISAILHKI